MNAPDRTDSDRARQAPHEVTSARVHLLWIIALTIAFELFAAIMRLGFDFQTTRDTAWLVPLTFGWRVHHSYVGAALVLAGWRAPMPHRWRPWVVRIGGALMISDLAHHLIVLPLTAGSPEFDLHYDRSGRY